MADTVLADAIRALLSHADGYRQPEWRDFLKVIFPAAEIFASPVGITHPGEDLPSGFQLGRVMLADGRRIAFIEQPVPPGIDLARNRVGLRQRVARLIDQESATGVLAVFTQEGDPNFRLSFVARESALVATDDGTALQLCSENVSHLRILGLDSPNEFVTMSWIIRSDSVVRQVRLLISQIWAR